MSLRLVWQSTAVAAMTVGVPVLACGRRVLDGTSPCTAYTAIHPTCPPSTLSAGCRYYVNEMADPPEGIQPASHEWVAPGCLMEIVPPTAPKLASCEHVDCVCGSDGRWRPASGSTTAFPCPQ
jgi:hypothetical protein